MRFAGGVLVGATGAALAIIALVMSDRRDGELDFGFGPETVRRHRPDPEERGLTCRIDGRPWPCDVVRLHGVA